MAKKTKTVNRTYKLSKAPIPRALKHKSLADLTKAAAKAGYRLTITKGKHNG